jgi:MFS family permease/protocatechuate 3,4-dioxygenase beta subunit
MAPSAGAAGLTAEHPSYKWVALSNTTLGTLIATINASIVLISLPAIFNGIKLNPLSPGNVSYLLWMLMGYMLVTAVLVVTLGRLGDMFGRVRIYNAGFALFTVTSIALSLDPWSGGKGALWLIGWRVVQAIGGAMLMANSAAILTDAFPAAQRGMALGINIVAGIAGQFIGLVLGGVLAEWNWRSVFWVNVPIGVIGTIWAYRSLRETAQRRKARIDWWGNLTFALGLTALLAGITYGIQPYGGHTQGWTNPWVLAGLIGGVAVLIIFCLIEMKVREPMFPLALFRDAGFASGNAANLLSSIARGGLQFMLIIWLQGIWLPLHGYNYDQTPLWAGIYLLPLTIGFLVAGPIAGHLSDRFGVRLFATGGLILMAASFGGLLLIPSDFNYGAFAALVFLNGLGGGLFAAPNTSLVMSSVPAHLRGAASGMRATFQNSGMVLSIGIFFSLMVAGLSTSLPNTMNTGLTAQGVPAPAAQTIAGLPPVGTLFAAFLGYNPIEELLGQRILGQLPAANAHTLTGRQFFPHLISGPFHDGLVIVFWLAIAMALVGALAALLTPKAAGREPAQDLVMTEERLEEDVYSATPLVPLPGASQSLAEQASPNGRANGASHPAHAADGIQPEPVAAAVPVSGAVVTGRVEGPDRRPVAGALLTVTDYLGHQMARQVSAADGSYRLDLPSGGSYLLICAAENHQPMATMLSVGLGEVGRDIALAGASVVEGRVLGHGGGPVHGATVTLTDARGEVVGAAVTGPDGGYVLADLYPGEYTLTAMAENALPVAQAIAVDDAGSHRFDVVLRSNATVTGTVRAARTGQPVADASVVLLDAYANVAGTAVTADDGRYEFAGLVPGPYTLTASGYAPVAARVDLAGERTERDIMLGAAGPATAPAAVPASDRRRGEG